MENDTIDWFFKSSRFGSDEIGWGPSYYGSRHSLPACLSLTSILLLGTTLVLLVAFVACVITARRRRLVTLFQGSMLIGTGFALALGMVDLQWYVGRASLVSSYSMYDSGLIVQGNLEIYVGLLSYNTTYYSINASAPSMRFFYNDQFYFYFNQGVGPVNNKLRALSHGLPNAVITINEYMDTYGDGFEWGLQFPTAGYYTFHLLALAAVVFAISVVLTFAVPELSVRLFPLTGAVMIASVTTFGCLLPSRSKTIYVEGTPINFFFGRTFFVVLLGGVINLGIGIILLVLRKCLNFGIFSTFLEIDFDTPFDDRHLKADSERRRQNLNRFFADSRLRSSMRRFRDTITRKRDTVVFRRSRSQEPASLKDAPMEHVTIEKKISNTLTVEKKLSNTLTLCGEDYVRIERASHADEIKVAEMPEVLPYGAVSLPPLPRGQHFRPRAHSEICIMPSDC